MKKLLKAVLFSILTILTLIGLFYLEPYLDEYWPFDILWVETVIIPLIAVLIMTFIKLIFFKCSEVTIMAIGFGSPLLVLTCIGHYFRELPNDSIYRWDFIFMCIIAVASFFISFFAMAILLKKAKVADDKED